MMRKIATIAALATLAGCVVTETETVEVADATPSTATRAADPAPASPAFTAPRGTSQRALAALPRGMSPAMLIRDGNGCYGLAIEATEPVQGIPLRDDTGQQVCDA